MPTGITTAGEPSRRQAILAAMHRRCEALGYDLTLDEIRDALRADGLEVPATLASEVSSMKIDGRLTARRVASGLRYAPPNFVATKAPPADDGELVLQALRLACEALGRMVSTGEVGNMLDRQEWQLDAGARTTRRSQETVLRHRLATQARRRATARQAEINQPLVLHREQTGTDGRPRSFWAPADRPDLSPPLTTASASDVEAARGALRDAVAATEMPLSQQHLGLYVLQLDGSNPVRQRLAGDGGRVHLAMPLRSAARPSGGACVRAVRTQWTVTGGAPPRYWLDGGGYEPDAAATTAVVLDDALYAWRLDEERAALQRLTHRLTAADRALLAPVLAARQATLRACLGHVLAATTGPLEAALVRAEAADRTVSAWGRRVIGRMESPYAPLRALEERRARRRSLAASLHEVTPASDPPADVVGVAGANTMGELLVFAPGIVDHEAGVRALKLPLRGCRRFPLPDNRHGRRGRGSGEWASPKGALALLDRAEALRALCAVVPDVRTRVLVNRSYSLLGHLTRNVTVLDAAVASLYDHPRVQPATRRSLVLAAALVGRGGAVPAAEALFAAEADSPEGEKDARAAVLALALAAPQEFTQHIGRLAGGARGPHSDVLRAAARRGRRGFLLGAAASV